MRISRGFIDLPNAQIHYRYAGEGGRRPLVMIHASPASSRMLEPLIKAMATDRRVIAPDTLGNGDSTGPIEDGADIGFFAETCMAALDKLGIGEFDLFGTHTGGSIAMEIAIAHPGRVKSLILDGLGLYEPEFQAELVERYAPALKLDLQGMYMSWIWHFVRDTYMFWPWYRLDKEHRRPLGLPAPRVLHDKVVDVLKAAETYHHPYRAAMRNDKRARLPLLKVRTLAACARDDMLVRYYDEMVKLTPGGRGALTEGYGTPEAQVATAQTFREFLETNA